MFSSPKVIAQTLSLRLCLGQPAGGPGVVQVNVRHKNDPHVIEGSADGAKSVLKSGMRTGRAWVCDRQALGGIEETGGDVAGSAARFEIEE